MNYTNYRPIAILPVINKIVEKVVIEQVSHFLEHHNIVSQVQHGFRRGRSTTTALTEFSNYVNNNLGDGQQVMVLFIDFKKAFDTLDHEQLLRAMDECGIRGPTNQWFREYLMNRTLRTVINRTAGDEARVSLGVPTGSVYGPVGYIMHVNSVSNVIKNCKVVMYADDMCLLFAGRCVADMVDIVQDDFENITRWAHDNGIILNINKTKCMILHSPYNKAAKTILPNDINVIGHSYQCLYINKCNCTCNKIELVNEFKYLGLLIDKHFNWNLHINQVCNKLTSILGQFYHLNRIVNRRTLHIVYHALADALISYGLSSYGLTFKSYLDRIKQLQLRIIKYLVNKTTKHEHRYNYDLLFSTCGILPVQCKVVYLNVLHSYYSEEFKVRRISKRNTRSTNIIKLLQPSVKNYYGKRTREYMIPKIYNEYPLLLDETKLRIGSLKLQLKKMLLDKYKISNT